MDDEYTAGYTVPCAQCSAVDWGISDEGRFYCRACHNVIERTREVVDMAFLGASNRVSTIRRLRTKKPVYGHVWMICEGFQFILKNQADALLRLGVRPHFKDDVLCPLWRRYLQRSRQAYTHDPEMSYRLRAGAVGSDSEGESNPPSTVDSNAESAGEFSGSSEAPAYLPARKRRSQSLLSMKKTLALIYLALVWSREALTLSDLLRLVNEGHVPYVNAYEQLPEEMKVSGRDAVLFRSETVPSHQSLHKETETLVHFLQLPAFPPIGPQTLLHPALLSLRYLTDANLPDELHPWVCRLMEHTGMADETLHTFDPHSHPVLPQYDLQASALIIVTMKLFFGLDDHTEWDLSNDVQQSSSGDMFNLRRWYKVMQAAQIRARQRRNSDAARRQWKAKKPIFPTKSAKYLIIKKKRIAEQVQLCFEKLTSCPAGVQEVGPSSFRFFWGDEEGSDGPCLHHMKLDEVVTLKDDFLTPLNGRCWHPVLRRCRRGRAGHYSEVEATLPRSFVWLLQLFSFMLGVKPSHLYEEVLSVERGVFDSKLRSGQSGRTGASPRTRRRSEERGGKT